MSPNLTAQLNIINYVYNLQKNSQIRFIDFVGVDCSNLELMAAFRNIVALEVTGTV